MISRSIFLYALGLDRLTKFFAKKYLSSGDLLVFPGFNLTLSYNRGISFGLLSSKSPLYFYGLTLFVTMVLVLFGYYMLVEYRAGNPVHAEAMVLAGGVSNIMDRLLYGGVIDFLDFYILDYHWYTFNLADAFIVLGITFIFLRSIQDVYTGAA